MPHSRPVQRAPCLSSPTPSISSQVLSCSQNITGVQAGVSLSGSRQKAEGSKRRAAGSRRREAGGCGSGRQAVAAHHLAAQRAVVLHMQPAAAPHATLRFSRSSARDKFERGSPASRLAGCCAVAIPTVRAVGGHLGRLPAGSLAGVGDRRAERVVRRLLELSAANRMGLTPSTVD